MDVNKLQIYVTEPNGFIVNENGMLHFEEFECKDSILFQPGDIILNNQAIKPEKAPAGVIDYLEYLGTIYSSLLAAGSKIEAAQEGLYKKANDYITQFLKSYFEIKGQPEAVNDSNQLEIYVETPMPTLKHHVVIAYENGDLHYATNFESTEESYKGYTDLKPGDIILNGKLVTPETATKETIEYFSILMSDFALFSDRMESQNTTEWQIPMPSFTRYETAANYLEKFIQKYQDLNPDVELEFNGIKL